MEKIGYTYKIKDSPATTSAELAGVISDEIGAGKLRFDTAVTTKTTTATLNVNEAGTILCSAAGGAYTITLPTAVGNTGLTYHFKKTDANYTLITIDGDGTETINYENSTSAPALTYTRLNTYCAEVTMVSDGSNWQVISEALGQVPDMWAHSSISIYDLTNGQDSYIILNSETTDIGSNFEYSTLISGTADGTVTDHLQDDTASPFTAAMDGRRVHNTTDDTYAWINTYNDAGDVTLSADIFEDGEAYTISQSKFVAPIAGKYRIQIGYRWWNTVETGYCTNMYYKNGAIDEMSAVRGTGGTIAHSLISYTSLAATNYIEPLASCGGGNTVDLLGGASTRIWMKITLVSKT